MKRIQIILAILAVATLIVACSHKPQNLIGESEMVSLLTDAYQLEGFYAIEHGIDAGNTDSAVVASYDALFNVHGVSREQFDLSMDYYMRHYDKYEKIHKKVIENLEDEQKH